ncbi:MAG: histidinol-phosphatase [Muribaculum sp.]|nr:histidinol-phosphatase [Muribaculum sp.]
MLKITDRTPSFMELKSIIETTDRYNFHSHTQFCDGRAPMSLMAEEACRHGFLHWGFSPHSPVNIESSCNMTQESVPQYIDEVKRLRDIYGDTMHIYASMEIDYISPSWGPSSDMFQSYPLDYRIGSVHFVPTRDGEWIDCDGNFERFSNNMRLKFSGDIRYVVETFFAQSISMVELGGFDIIGHLDKISHNASRYSPGIEDESWYIALTDQLINAISRRGLIAEVNTKAFPEYGRLFPSERILQQLIKMNVPIVVNSDAHYPEKVDYGRKEALDIILNLSH